MRPQVRAVSRRVARRSVLISHSITYRIAVGSRAGQKLFSLHASIDIEPHQRVRLERLCRYVSRPPVAEERLALTASGQVRYTLKTPYRDGTTHIVLEPLDLMARLAALVPPPRMHLTVPQGIRAARPAARSRDVGGSG